MVDPNLNPSPHPGGVPVALEGGKKLSGLDKAAILLLALPESFVVKVFSKLDVSEIKVLSQRMALLGRIRADMVEGLLMEFVEEIGSSDLIYGSYEVMEQLLDKVFDKEKVKEIMGDIRGPAGRTMWEKLNHIPEDILAQFLENEYPQTIAVILSKIKPEHAARILSKLKEEVSFDVVKRILTLDVVHQDVLKDVEETLRTELVMNLTKTRSKKKPHEQVADIFNAFDRATEARFMEALEKSHQEEAEKIRSLMFTFDDLVKLDNAGIQTLIRVADKTKLVMALKGAPDALKDLFFKNMSERAAKLIREDMESLGMVRLKAVDEAQQDIVVATKDLIKQGEITILEGGEDEQMVG